VICTNLPDFCINVDLPGRGSFVPLFIQAKILIMEKVIFITGASRGFGRLWTEAFLKRGDKVAATVRDLRSLDGLVRQYGDALLPIQLDVTDRQAAIAAVNRAKDHFGRIDVLINNAGYGLFGTIEETTEQQARDQMEANFFGLLWLTQAALPIMRAQGHGHIIQLSSMLGILTLPVLGIYNASKFAVEGLSETLATEVKGFGIHVTLVEPNGFATDWGGASAAHTETMSEYDAVRKAFNEGITDDAFGKPEATVDAILQLVDSPHPPLRLFLGKVALPWAKQVYTERLATWEGWSEVAAKAHGK
jgi:NAD(P)-dependent dehydrogenase (short-subunit alcohol dehydrogenase family)